MTVPELCEQIRKRASELGIDLETMAIYDDEDLLVRSLTFFLNNLEDVEIEEEISDIFEEDFYYDSEVIT